MSYHPLELGPTFIPGGLDDFYIPQKPADLVSPAPQRVMPEMPGQMQESFAALDLDGNLLRHDAPQNIIAPSLPAKAYASVDKLDKQTGRQIPNLSMPETREERDCYSYFPKLRKRTLNVPPSPQEQLAVLEAARLEVLSSLDPEMQLLWAQDALNYSEASIEERRRSGSLLADATVAKLAIGKIEQRIQTDAANIVMYLADQYHPKADFLKGTWLEFGKFGFAEDKLEAFRCYKRSAAKGYFRAEYRMGMQYEFTGENVKALQHYKIGEARGDAASSYRMGMMSLMGQLGQSQDFETAIRLIQQAADAADENAPQAAYVYGMLQARELPQISVPEIFLPVNTASALHYIEKSAYLGFSKAQLKMGSAYELCSLGCEFDPVLSLHYNYLAARQGEEEAEMSISKWFLCGYEDIFPKNNELAFIYAQRAATTGLATAQFAMGYFYEVGVHVGRNLPYAQDWYEKSARNGSDDARGRIVSISKSRTLSKVDHENAVLSRIRSRHGSRRGHRHGWPNKPLTPMPQVPDEYFQSSRTSRTDTPAPLSSPIARTSPLSSKPTSATPYPSDDRHIFATPYPFADDASLTGGPNNPASGFLDLNLDQWPFARMIETRYESADRRYAKNSSSSSPLSRVPDATGRGDHPILTISNLSPRINSAGALKANLRFEQESQMSNESSSTVEKLDIGFFAPIDPQADRLNRVGPKNDAGGRKISSKTPGSEKSKMPAKIRRNSTPKVSNPVNSRTVPSTFPLPVGVYSDSVEVGVPRFSSQSLKPPVPSKGPQTFDEMGVPAGKDEHDCVVM